jgi:hypothetical protein
MQMWPPVLYGALPPGGAPGQMLHVDPALMGGGAGTYENSPVLKLKGLPFAATTEDIAAFFAGFALVSARVHLGLDGRPSGMVRCCILFVCAHAHLTRCGLRPGVLRVCLARGGGARHEPRPRVHGRALRQNTARAALRGVALLCGTRHALVSRPPFLAAVVLSSSAV